MAGPTIFHIIRRGDLVKGQVYSQWDDPDKIAPFSPQGLRTFLDNPSAGNDDEPVQIIATRDNRVIGRIDMLPVRIRAGEVTTTIMWGSNLYVPPEARNTLTGVTLILKAQSLHHTVGAHGPSQAALPVYQKLKWFDRAIPRRILILRSRSVIEKYAGNGMHSKILASLADFALAAHRLLLLKPWTMIKSSGLTLDRINAMPQEIEPMLARCDSRVGIQRSVSSINWWLTHTFKDDVRNINNLFLIKGQAGNVVGYFINKVRFHPSATHRGFKNLLLGSIQDWMIFDANAIDFRTIVMLAVRELSRQRVDAIEFCTDDSSLNMTLKLLGFLRVGAAHLVIKCSQASPLSAAEYADISKWWIRPGDGDNFFI